MTRREEIVTATLGYRKNYVNLKRRITSDDVADAFEKGASWADATIIERLRELKSDCENELDVKPRNYERDIQLFTKIALIHRIIVELEGGIDL